MQAIKLKRELIVPLSLILLSTSCFYSRDVTLNENYFVKYRKGQVYKTRVNLLLKKHSIPYLVTPGVYGPNLKEYRENPKKHLEILGVIESNTKIIIDNLTHHNTFESSYVEVTGIFLNGEFEGERVGVELISMHEYLDIDGIVSIPIPDPKVLTLESKL